MGYDLVAALFFLALLPLVIVGFILFWLTNARAHAKVAESWGRYAKSRELDFVAPSGEWPNRASAVISWSHAGAELRIQAVGREASVRTRLVVRPKSALLGSLVVVCDQASAGEPRMRERPAGFARRILDDRVKRALLGFRQRDRVTLAYRRGRVTVEWPGAEVNDARLDAARGLGEQIASTVEDQFHRAAADAPCPPGASIPS